jgi:regulator of ribonuclease activity A
MRKFKTADLSDSLAERAQVCAPLFRDYGGRRAFCGPIATVECFEDNALVGQVLSEPGDGRVLVVDGGGSDRCAMLGDTLARKAVFNGWSGILMHGYIRDAEDISRMPLGVKALGTYPLRSVKRGSGKVEVPVSFGGTTFSPGDMLYADLDGVLLVPTGAEA